MKNRPKKHFDAFKTKEDYFAAFDYFRPNIYGFIRMKVRGDQTVGDLFDDTFLHGAERFDQFRGGCFLTWIFLVARTVIHAHYAKEKRRPVCYLQDFPEWNVKDKVTEQGFEQVRDRELIEYALSFVNKDTAEALRLYGDHTVHEIAEILNLPFVTVKSRVFRGQKAIQRALADQVAA